MTRGELKDELMMILKDPTIEHVLDDWLNQALLSLAAEYEIPSLKLKEPVTLAVTEDDWLYDLPASFLKKLFRVTNGNPSKPWLHISPSMDRLDMADRTHTQTGTFVQRVAYEDRQLGIYPKADDTLSLWYYRTPTLMADDDDEPVDIPEAFHDTVLIPKVVLRGFREYPELARNNIQENARALDYWRTKLREGLYGSAQTGQTGLLGFYIKSQPPRVRGSHPGRMLP